MWLVDMFCGKVGDLRKSIEDIQTNIDPEGNITMKDLVSLDNDVIHYQLSVDDFREAH